jgi:hypothetical protein
MMALGDVEGIDRGGLRKRSVLHVIDRHAVDLARPRQRRTELYGGERHAVRGGRLLDARPILVEPFDQAGHEVAPVPMRDLGQRGGDVHDAVALHDANVEVVKICKLHECPPFLSSRGTSSEAVDRLRAWVTHGASGSSEEVFRNP